MTVPLLTYFASCALYVRYRHRKDLSPYKYDGELP